MKTRKQNKQGFTLIEVIIVVIIIGVLASLALPRLFEQIEYSRSTEAVSALGEIKRAAHRCDMRDGAAADTVFTTNCGTFAQLSMDDPGAAANSSFVYTPTAAADNLTVVAGLAGASSATDIITLVVSQNLSGSITGAGEFSGLTETW